MSTKPAAMPTNIAPFELFITLAALLAGAGLAGAMVWLQRRPRDSLEPSLLPTTPLMFAGVIIGLLAVVHLLNLWGIHTGRY